MKHQKSIIRTSTKAVNCVKSKYNMTTKFVSFFPAIVLCCGKLIQLIVQG